MAQAGGGVASNLPALFSELNRHGENGEYDRALKVVNKILQESSDDEKAFQCKVVCLIQLSQFEEALAFLRKNPKYGSSLVFEKAYCEYRLNRTEDALKTIKAVANPDDRLRELLGQVLYRMEDFNECYLVYKDLLKNTQDDFEEERETNLSAVMAALELWGDGCEENLSMREDTYELCYNAACQLLGKRQYAAAVEKFKHAEELCRKAHEEDVDSAEDCDAELGVIWVQMGYALQKLGQNEAAMKLYNQVMKHRQSDVVLAAVASNNIITINKDQNVFDSKKKIKVATSDALKQKLTLEQRRRIAMNECLLYMYMGQSEQCRRLAQTLRTAYPDCDLPSLIEAAQCVREKNTTKAIECLQTQLDSGVEMLRMKLALAQLYLSHEHIYKACDLLRTLGSLSYSPGVVSTLVTLYSSQEDKESAADVLSKAITWYHANDPTSANLPMLVRASANFHLQLGSPQVAAEMLEELHRQNPSDLKTLAQLITAYSKFDPTKAQAVSSQLPSVGSVAKDVDVDGLEASFTLLSSKYGKKAAGKAEPSPRPNSTVASRGDGDIVVKKKKKKKKKLLPKNYDPSALPDPERWLPLRERSYYRGKRKNKKREIGKGTQGAATASTEFDASKSTSPPGSQISSPKPGAANTPSTATPTSNQPGAAAGPRQQKPQAGANKQRGGGKKKKGGKGW